jgi:hypothetical protein
MTLPDFITFTGVDVHTSPAGLAQLLRDYPGRIEWGILFSPKRQGIEPRYPALGFVHELVREIPMAYAAHLCGGDARDVLESCQSRHDELLRYFARAQINTADPSVQPSLVRQWADRATVQPILQCRGPFPDVRVVDVLFDKSGGRGIENHFWPRQAPNTFCGYAGGIGPDNVAAIAQKVSDYGSRYWLDMESRIRDEHDHFSLAKCRAVCEAVYGPPAGSSGEAM